MPDRLQAFSGGVLFTQLAQAFGVRDVHSNELAVPFLEDRIRGALLAAKIEIQAPASACCDIPITCASVNLLRFILVLLCQEC